MNGAIALRCHQSDNVAAANMDLNIGSSILTPPALNWYFNKDSLGTRPLAYIARILQSEVTRPTKTCHSRHHYPKPKPFFDSR